MATVKKSSSKKKAVSKRANKKVAGKKKSSRQTVVAQRPTHIAVFKKLSEDNLEVCTSILGAKGSSLGAHVMQLQTSDGSSAGKVYNRLGVAAVNLNAEQFEALSETNEVEAVFKNEIRTIPKPVVEQLKDTDSIYPENVVSYLRGVRDGLNLTLSQLQNEPIEPMASFASQAKLGQSDDKHWPLEMIGMSECYSKYTGSGIKVAVLDTGLDLSHPDFEGRVEEGDTAVSFVDGESVQDENGHGTHCVGVVASPISNNGSRRYGVAPNIDLLVGKVLSNAGSGYDDQIIEGIEWAEEAGAQIISMSLGSDRRRNAPFNILYERIARNMLQGNPGTLLIAAAGNESNRPHWTSPVGNPAACPSIMAVSAIDKHWRVASFSCRQKDSIGEVNLTAPGHRIYSSWTGGGYKTISGTSMATPHVAGAAALYLEQNPSLTPLELWSILESNAHPLDSIEDFGSGLVQVP